MTTTTMAGRTRGAARTELAAALLSAALLALPRPRWRSPPPIP